MDMYRSRAHFLSYTFLSVSLQLSERHSPPDAVGYLRLPVGKWDATYL
jgi:hypothetical protein